MAKKGPDFSFEGSWDWKKTDFEKIKNFPRHIFILKLAAALKNPKTKQQTKSNKQKKQPENQTKTKSQIQTSQFNNSLQSSLTENTQSWKKFYIANEYEGRT